MHIPQYHRSLEPTVFGFSKLILSVLSIIIFATCSSDKQTNADNTAFAKYIEGYTTGVISKNEAIVIRLASQVNTLQKVNEEDNSNLIEISPRVKGKTVWADARTIHFIPEQAFEPGKQYHVKFGLGKVTEVPKELSSFNFDFKIIEPGYEIVFDGLKSQSSNSLDLYSFSGTIQLADAEENGKIEKILEYRSSSKTAAIKWQHNLASRTSSFTIDSIQRGDQANSLFLKWNGSAISSKHQGEKTWEVPAKGTFTVLDVRAVQDAEQFVLVQFSDPILVAQDLEGLIQIQEINGSRFTIDGSEVKVYPFDRLEGSYTVSINEGVENIANKKITSSHAASVNFENRLPSVSIPGSGTILPGSGKLTLPFEAVNLKAVDVTIIKIYENNIPQYFQISYENNHELRRVGKPIVQKTIALDGDKSLNLRRKNRFSLDVDELIKTEPGAIYRVLIGFRQAYSVYNCDGEPTTPSSGTGDEYEVYDDYYYSQNIDEDDAFWSRYNNYYPYDYRWEERDNPCHSSYYTTARWVSRDLLASNIGLIVKRGNDNSMSVIATSIQTAQPLEGVEIKLLNYQQQVLQTARTGADGFANFEVGKKPYLLIASKNEERGYLKLDDGLALPLGRFDVGGDIVQEGIKGFLYGERGVWRPGDSIYLSFILEKQSANLPDNHPVTLELYDPKGQLNQRMVESKHTNGFYTFKTSTASTAPTGNWRAKVSVGGAVFHKTIKIETVMPNRLRINLDFGAQKILRKGSKNEVQLSSQWLFGADVQNLKARVEGVVTPVRTNFEGYKNYQFDDPTRSFPTESQVLFDGTLDEQGRARFSADGLSGNQSPGMLRAALTTRVFEPGGNFSIDYLTIPYSPYDVYMGVQTPQGDRLSGMLLTDQDHPIDIVAVDPNGKRLTGKHQVQVEFYKIRWRWWWNQEGDYLGNFTQDQYNQLLKKEVITLNNGAGKWNVRVNYPDWGRYLVRVVDLNGSHATGRTLYIDWPGWAKREQHNNPTEASMLSFTADKESYKVGEQVTLTIPSSAGGRGLVSIENGSKVLKTYWINTEQGQTTHQFKVDETMAPNVFVNVTLLQPHAQTANDLPIRMYGVIPLLVEDPKTMLKPVIHMPQTIRPETKSRIQVSEASGKAMTYTIAIVDEGLLDLTRFQTPDPHSRFYAREALGVKSWDLFDQVLGAWGGNLERILSIGGDGDVDRNVNPAKANRFQPVVKFLGPFTLRKGGKNTHEFALPQYIGSVRAMVIAGQDGAYGFAEQPVAVKKPLMLLGTLPRVIGPGETFRLPLTVFAMEDQIKNVRLEVSGSGGLQVQDGTQQVNFAKPGEEMAFVTIKAGADTGIGKIKAVAKSGNETATYEVEIDIRNPNPYITTVDQSEVAASAEWSREIKPLGPGNRNTASVEVSSLPPINLDKRLNYLIRYPHGCLEQVTSGVFPQLMLHRLTPLSDQQKSQVQHNVRAGINRIRGYQLANGGLGYWPGATQADEWSTNYAGHFLLEAQALGHQIPPGVLDNWIRFQRGAAQSWAPDQYNWRGGDLLQAYRLYLLAMAKSPEIGAMNRLREFRYLSDEAAWRLAAAYHLAGQQVVANQLVKDRPIQFKPYEHAGRTFGSTLRDQAMLLETLLLLNKPQEAQRVLMGVATGIGSDNWHSTQTTAYALLAIGKFSGSGKNSFTYSIDGKSHQVTSETYLHSIPLEQPNSASTLKIQNKGNNKLYIRIIRAGQLPAGENPPQRNNPELITMEVKYTDRNGAEIDPSVLTQGTDFIAEVKLRNTARMGTYEHIALTQIFPSGWEIMNARMSGGDSGLQSATATYQDIRDDRVLTYFNLQSQETRTYRIMLNASYVGRYFLPSVSAEAMYDDRITAINTGRWVEVSD